MKDYDNFFLPSNDLNETKMFYSNLLGLKVKFDFSEKGMIAFNVGNQEPSIIIKDINKFPRMKPVIWFVVDSVNDKYDELKEKGIEFLSEPFQIKTGMAAEFEDPFGNRLGITDYLKD
jgi:predicted enzyme related to lactoylglutathione lyase